MTDPVRLLAGEGSELERALLRTWETRQPSDDARAKVLAIAGLGVAAGLATVASGVGGSIAPKAVASGIAAKWLAMAAIGCAVTAGAVGYAVRSTSSANPPAKPATPSGIVQETNAQTVAPPPAAPPPADVLANETSPQTVAPVQVPVASPPAGTGGTSSGTAATDRGAVATSRASAGAPLAATHVRTLDDEVAMVDRARRAVTGGDGVGAIALVEAYEAKFPSGALTQEAAEVRIEAYLQKGDRTTAERLASRFIEAHPSSPYVRRIRALLASGK